MGIAEAIAITKIVTAKNFAILPSRVAGNRSAFLALFQSNLFSISTRKANKNLDDQQRLREAAPAIKDFALRHRLRRSVTAKRLNCASLILLNIEDRGQPRHLEQVMHSLIQVCELQFSTLVTNRCVSLNQLPDSRAVDVLNLSQIQNYFLVSFVRQITNNIAENDISFAQRDSSADIKDGRIAQLPDGCLHFDRRFALHTETQLIEYGACRSCNFVRLCPNHDQPTPLFKNLPEENDVLRTFLIRGWLGSLGVV